MGQYPSTESHTFTPSDAFFLTEATRTGSLDVVRLFLRKNPALVYASQAADHNTPWHVAAAAGHELVLRVLLDTTRANAVSNTFDPLTKVINKQNAKGQTPLMLACGGGHSVCVRLLLESGAHLLVADAAGLSALHYAASHNGVDGAGNDCVELLVAHMQQQLRAQGPQQAPPAVHANVIRKFADTGDLYGRTALHYAAWSGNTRAAHALWAVGADICARTETDCYDADLPCNTGTTPLHFAAMRGHQAVVVLLLAAWHRMVTRPGAPLPRPSFTARPPLAGAGGGSSASVATAAGEGGEGEAEPEPAAGAAEGEGREGKQAVAGGGGSAGGAPDGAEPGDATVAVATSVREDGGKVAAEGKAGGSAGGAAAEEGSGGTAAEAASHAKDKGPEKGPDGAKPESETRGSAGGEQASPPAASSIAGSSSAGGAAPASSTTRHPSSKPAAGAAAATAYELPPPPPSPRVPASDPRLMVDAYGMTPYSIACKRKQDRGSMLIELLDPATDFCAGEDPACGEAEAAGAAGAAGAAAEGEKEEVDGNSDDKAALLPRARASSTATAFGRERRRGGLAPAAGGSDSEGGDDGDGSDSDDSESGADGPLLLWEGVELIQGIAADPEAFFALQRSAPLLQPQQPAEPLSAVAAAAGGGRASGGVLGASRISGIGGGGIGRAGGGAAAAAAGGHRASATSTVGGRERRRSSGSGDESTALLEGAEGGGGGDRAGGRGSRAARRSTMAAAEEMVPDCFLCPLTCRLFKDPVVAADGVTYEREAVERHLRHVATSPVTKQRLPSTATYPNNALKAAIEHWQASQAMAHMLAGLHGAGGGGGGGGGGPHRSSGSGSGSGALAHPAAGLAAGLMGRR
ncbi:hypothetical protein HYH02_014427 [Chlamydomonas schloesseri]|uniref:U-box domain-containing protein n=1 Tax=Chlamydomonas schloesseri TaxID=2026947 RepID=A0A835VUE6_9CHLO|nr:hypothetical protein HYH02_014427 [Chlamydomonas schloesseri]|eukprot:KAG2428245.1 hypothetical protein HYH02_014427 [Chlamydomonas schloesseri]